MAVYYRIWARLERINPEASLDEPICEDIGKPAPLGRFDTFEEAEAFIKTLKALIIDDNSPVTTDKVVHRCPTTITDIEGRLNPIIGCDSKHVVGPDDEGLYDCLDCGMWFTPDKETQQEVPEELVE